MERATEWLCIAKTRRGLYSQVEKSILQHHPYETPEILAVPVVEGSKSYIAWLNQETAKRNASGDGA
jgi:periplasmic divalent cation tolerance protein